MNELLLLILNNPSLAEGLTPKCRNDLFDLYLSEHERDKNVWLMAETLYLYKIGKVLGSTRPQKLLAKHYDTNPAAINQRLAIAQKKLVAA